MANTFTLALDAQPNLGDLYSNQNHFSFKTVLNDVKLNCPMLPDSQIQNSDKLTFRNQTKNRTDAAAKQISEQQVQHLLHLTEASLAAGVEALYD